MLDLIMLGFWLALVTYAIWYLFKAKTIQPLTLDDLALTWKIHKHQTKCKASHIHTLLVKDNEVVGFKCECGHETIQKRLITQNVSTYLKGSIPLSLSPKIKSVLNTKNSLENLGLQYSHIKRI